MKSQGELVCAFQSYVGALGEEEMRNMLKSAENIVYDSSHEEFLQLPAGYGLAQQGISGVVVFDSLGCADAFDVDEDGGLILQDEDVQSFKKMLIADAKIHTEVLFYNL